MTQLVKATRLLTHKGALDQNRIDSFDFDLSVAPGEIVLRPDHFALTTNNITYAAFGDSMRYWDFYSTGAAEWGHMPMWGFAGVVASAVEGIEIGARYYGYYPIAATRGLRPRPRRVASARWMRIARSCRRPTTSTPCARPIPTTAPSTRTCRRCSNRCT